MNLSYDEIAERLVDWCVADDSVRALWLEGSSLEELRRPYGSLELHVATDEPQFVTVVAGLESCLDRLVGGKVEGVTDTERFAKEFRFRVGKLGVKLIAEQSHLLAKRPRAEVVSLVDKTGHLPHVLDYSLRRS